MPLAQGSGKEKRVFDPNDDSLTSLRKRLVDKGFTDEQVDTAIEEIKKAEEEQRARLALMSKPDTDTPYPNLQDDDPLDTSDLQALTQIQETGHLY